MNDRRRTVVLNNTFRTTEDRQLVAETKRARARLAKAQAEAEEDFWVEE